MKTKRVLIPLLLVAALAIIWFFVQRAHDHRPPAPASVTRSGPSPAVKAEWEKFRGKWKFVSLEVEGVKKPDTDFNKYTLIVADDQWTIFDGDKVLFRTYFDLDPTQQPKTIDIYPDPEATGGKVIRGIYEHEGDTWRLCDRDVSKGSRPTEFATSPESGLVLVAYKRVKE